MSDDSPIVSVHDDRIIYRASGLGSCTRALVAARNGFAATPPPPTLQKAFQQGHALEASILKRLVTEFDWTLEPNSEQYEVSLHVGTLDSGQRLIVLGHVDALGTPPGGRKPIPIDAKAFSGSLYNQLLTSGISVFPRYQWQLSAYCVAYGSSGYAMPVYNKETGDIRVWAGPNEFDYDDIANRIYTIEAYSDPTDVDCSPVWGCPYQYLHDSTPPNGLPDELAEVVRRYREIGDKIELWNRIRKVLADQVIEQLPYDDKTRTFKGNGLSVTVQSNARRLDTTKVKTLLKDAEIDIDDYYKPGEGVHIVVKAK